MLLPNARRGVDADLMTSYFTPRARGQSFVATVASYQTFRKQDPRRQIISNETRRCYRKRNRAARLVCGRLFRRGCLSAELVTWVRGPQCSEIEQREAGAGKRRPRSPGQLSQGPASSRPSQGMGHPSKGWTS